MTAAPGAATTQPLPSQKRLRLAIVGGGPLCVYALERLVAHLSVVADAPGSGLRIEIFERSGRFGAGEVNSDRQPLTSLLNRVAAQIGFSADESNRRLSALLPQPARPTFHEWAQRRFRDTGDPTYALGPMSIPPRRLHGEALAEAFAGHAAALAGFGVEVRTHAAEVVDLAPSPEDAVALRATCEGIDIGPVDVDRVLLATGNAASFARRPSSRIADDGGPRRIAQAYPLQRQLDLRTVPADTAVAIRGLGLTAVDVFLHLTEGRGGRFETVSRIDPALRYVACGGEPQRIVAFSPSGMLPCCRAQNFKLLDPALAYRGVFFTLDAVARLRDVRGVPMRLHDGDTVRQLDFEADALPLVVLELARAYYLTLLGFEFDARAVAETSPVYQAFLDADASVALRGEAAIDALLAPLQMAFESACRVLGAPAGDVVAADAVYAVHRDAMRTAFDAVLFAPALPGRSRPDDLPATRPGKSPWGHPLSLPEHRFDWRRLFHPLRDPPMTGVGEPSLPEDAWRSRLIAFVRQDLRNARQGNLRNPIKAACDGVLRDLRSVFGALVDHGGLHAASHAAFLDGFMRTYHRLSNGAGIEAIEKTLALIDAGLVDLDVGPGASVAVDAEGFVLSGPRTGATRRAMVLIEGRLSAFDAADPVDPLYTNLLRRGLVRRWVNPGRAPDPDFVPGGLDLSPRFHPYDAAGDEDTRLTAMGTPAEGQRLLQSAAARPCCDSDVFNRLDVWASDILAALPSSRFPGT